MKERIRIFSGEKGKIRIFIANITKTAQSKTLKIFHLFYLKYFHEMMLQLKSQEKNQCEATPRGPSV